MLSEGFLTELKAYIKYNQIEDFLFPGPGPGKCVSSRFANYILHSAAKKAGITKNISYHTLRRTSPLHKGSTFITPWQVATHLHEAGYSLRDIQVVMGHSTSRTTERYTKVSNIHISNIQNPLDNLTGLTQERRPENQNRTVVNPQNFNQKQTNQFPQQARGNNAFISPYKHKIVYREK